uniref:Uncharacterized protein n=1 Tax=Mycena chlorophos TaxID=658473 RepID=A0ABQ0M3K1_MYCCL|nr:predicted protein [Mycena chlorophos]
MDLLESLEVSTSYDRPETAWRLFIPVAGHHLAPSALPFTTTATTFTMEVDLVEMLRSMQIAKPESANTHPTAAAADCLMSDIHDDPRPNSPSYQGCEFLQAIQSQLDFPTTGGAYIDTILTHRQIFYAYPRGHQCCSRAFSDFACALQQREWRADRDSDVEAAAAFNYEAQVIASVFP